MTIVMPLFHRDNMKIQSLLVGLFTQWASLPLRRGQNGGPVNTNNYIGIRCYVMCKTKRLLLPLPFLCNQSFLELLQVRLGPKVTPGQAGSPKNNFWELSEQDFLQAECPSYRPNNFTVVKSQEQTIKEHRQ